MQRCQSFCLIIKEYISRWIHTSNKALTLSWRKLVHWFTLQINGLVSLWKELRKSYDALHWSYSESLFLHVVKQNWLFLFIFSIRFFFSRISWFTGQQEKEEAISLTSLYHFDPLYRRLDITHVIAAASPLVSYRKSLSTKLRAL